MSRIDHAIARPLIVTALLATFPISSRAQAPSIESRSPATDRIEEADLLEKKAKLALEDGDVKERVKLLEAALAIREKLQGPDHLDTAKCLQKLGASYGSIHRGKDAGSCLDRALEIRVKAFGRDHLLVAETLDTMAGASINNNDCLEAKNKFGEALEIKRKVAGPESLEVAESYLHIATLAFIVFQQGGKKHKDSVLPDQMLRLALKIQEEKLGPDAPEVANTLGLLSNMLYYHGNYAEAESLVKRGLAIYEKIQGSDGKDVAIFLQLQARIHRHNGPHLLKSWQESHKLEARSGEILKKIEELKRNRNEIPIGPVDGPKRSEP